MARTAPSGRGVPYRRGLPRLRSRLSRARGRKEVLETLRVELLHIEATGDGVVYAFRFRAKGADSGVEVDLEFANAVRLSHGLQIEIVARRSLGEAREIAARQPTTRRDRHRFGGGRTRTSSA
jgi:hypothetical protein